MLQSTFVHIPGIGRQTELELWENGIESWDDADRFEKRFGFAGIRLQEKLDHYIPRSREAVRRKDASFFSRLSVLGESWRMYPEFSERCLYLDIETTGLSSVFDSVTMVGLYDGRKYKAFVQGHNLDELPAHLKGYSLLVTFNGAGFDLRFLSLAFPDLALPPVHIDLRWATRRLGMRGGLKTVEEELGLRRPSEVKDLSGHDAVVLWAKYQRGDRHALEQLIRYNTEDVVHLKAISEIVYDRLSGQTAAFLRSSAPPKLISTPRLPRPSNKPFPTTSAAHRSSTGLVPRLLKKCGSERRPRIVGIDLTGSERRATGWALMDGAQATTKTIRTDEELISETLAAKPDLVSIDSPLSLPENHGSPSVPIYRKCELGLKRMGISVFWCLLPSMEMLTRRGMRLAQTLRNAGCNVIESYPGAAQDILGIPRKKTSLEELKWGLSRAGINGKFLTAPVTHDELDAITSALVGVFYLADEYIALGTKSEDYLIIPRSERFNQLKLAEIIAKTGLDEVPQNSGSGVESLVHAKRPSAAAR
jgi:uncharacterized protein YprB with RNaseH-like and TPR domain/predicted nuclease with RNAse H fold